MAISFKDMLPVDYMPGQDDLIKRNAKKRKSDTTGGTNAEYSSTNPPRTDEDLEVEALNIAQRRKRAMQMKKYRSRLDIGRKKAMSRVADSARLKRRARKAARNFIAKRLTKGVSKAELNVARKQEIEKMLNKMPARIDRVAKKLLPKLRKKELSRRSGSEQK
jgi:hypothetical protein